MAKKISTKGMDRITVTELKQRLLDWIGDMTPQEIVDELLITGCPKHKDMEREYWLSSVLSEGEYAIINDKTFVGATNEELGLPPLEDLSS